MKTETILKIFTTLILVSSSFFVSAQSMKELQVEIERAEREIKISTELLNSSEKREASSLRDLKITRSRISSRKSIIKKLGKQADIITRNISSENRKIQEINDEIATLKADYSKMVVTAYKNYKLNNYMLFLFASKDFNDATKRIAYMKRYNNMREAKADQIEKLRLDVEIKIKDLNSQHIALGKTTSSRKTELTALNSDESRYKGDVKSHQSNQSSINRKLRAQISERNKAQQRLEQIIAEESRKNKTTKKSEVEEKYDIELSGRFDQNIGKLPYPIRGGVIVDRYGVHWHPTIKGLKVKNNGINIAGKSSAPVYSVFDGVVSRVIFLQGQNNCIIVRHGNYITLYANLSKVNVKTGDKVELNQVLGELSSSSNTDDYTLHFEIWKETKTLNPESCLRR